MKLAEALALRADLQKRISQLRSRLLQNALVQEGEQPAEDPQAMMADVARLLDEQATLITRINRTNLLTEVSAGMTVTAALARRDMLEEHHSILNGVADTASNRVSRYSKAEIRAVATVDVRALRQQIDVLAQQRRELDVSIQAANWGTELLES